MTSKVVTQYKCDHCSKKMVVQSAMQRHEEKCFKNPANFRVCHDCIHLQETEIEYFVDTYQDYGGFGEKRKTVTGFRCTKFDLLLYPYKAEYKNLPNKYPETFEGQEPMRKECEAFNYKYSLPF
jgi:hypothetical protein